MSLFSGGGLRGRGRAPPQVAPERVEALVSAEQTQAFVGDAGLGEGEEGTAADRSQTQTRPGPHAGTRAAQGRRTQAPPSFAPLAPPSRRDLGLDVATDAADADTAAWPLHAKHVSQISWPAVHALAAAAPLALQTALSACEKLCTDPAAFPILQRAITNTCMILEDVYCPVALIARFMTDKSR